MLIYLDYHGLIQLHWSPLILDEVSRALVDTGRKQTLKEAKAHEARMCEALPDALVSHNTKDFKKAVLAKLTIAQPVEVNAAFRHFRLDLTPKPAPESLWERLERDGGESCAATIGHVSGAEDQASGFLSTTVVKGYGKPWLQIYIKKLSNTNC